MNKEAKILVATDNTADAALVQKLLRAEFENVFVSTVADLAVADFERRQPDVLVLAFDTLGKAELYYLGLYRLSKRVHTQPHRTLILCNKDDVQRVYALCKKEYFDDYILFWPMTHDAPRLPMAVFHALRDLESTRAGPSSAELASAARRIGELEALLEQGFAQGGERAEAAQRSLQQAEADIGAALDGFSARLLAGGWDAAVEVRDVPRLQREIAHLKDAEVGRHLRGVGDAVTPMGQWIGALKNELAPQLESARALQALAERVRPVVLVVDDDEFQRKLIARLLAAGNYDLVFAASGAEALAGLRKQRPDLILLDVMMPEIDGLEVLRRLKAAQQFASIPVMMITGQSDKAVVVDSLKAGAVDFVVKPVEREILLKKVARFLAG
jgi:CheY-like chemotaxis protein